MKTNKNLKSPKGIRVDADFPANKGVKKDRSDKRRLSIYDDFEDENTISRDVLDYDSSDNSYDN